MISQLRPRPGVLVAHYAVLTAVALVFLFPVVFMVVSSLKPNLQLLRDSGSLRAFVPVGDISLRNYAEAFERVPIPRFLFNSLLVTAVTVAIGLFVNSLAAFSFAHVRWRGRQVVLAFVIATFIVPFETIAIPLLLLVSKLPWLSFRGLETSWLNSYHVQIIPFIAHGFQVFLFYQFFRDIPGSLLESAKIDGAGLFRVYARIVIPLSGPAIATVVVLRSLEMWNQYLWPIMTIQSSSFRPIMVGLQYFFQLNVEWGEVMAYLSVVTVPILLVYFRLQRSFIESVAATGVKE